MKQMIDDWQQHSYQELGSIVAEMMEFNSPDELATRLEKLTLELRSCYISNLYPSSSRQEINQIQPWNRFIVLEGDR